MLRYPSAIPVLKDPVTGDEFSAEEMQLFRKRFDNGYDLEHDVRYNEWKKKGTLKKSATVTNDGIIMKKAECTVCHGYYAVTFSGTIRLHGPQFDRCPGSQQPVGIGTDMSNSSVTPLPSFPSPYKPRSVNLKNTSSTVPITDIIKPTSIRTLKKTATSTNDTQPKLTLRNNATNDDTHKKLAAIDDITQPGRTLKKTATDSLKETATNNDVGLLLTLKKTAANDDITQPKCTLKPATSLKKTATNDDITQARRTFRKTASQHFKKTATNNGDL
uniref:Uncharacterized protein n=1 Tax=Amphimedon queenslandica TaxID=400682 RepID=A0A1X7UI85_AMPQE